MLKFTCSSASCASFKSSGSPCEEACRKSLQLAERVALKGDLCAVLPTNGGCEQPGVSLIMDRFGAALTEALRLGVAQRWATCSKRPIFSLTEPRTGVSSLSSLGVGGKSGVERHFAMPAPLSGDCNFSTCGDEALGCKAGRAATCGRYGAEFPGVAAAGLGAERKGAV